MSLCRMPVKPVGGELWHGGWVKCTVRSIHGWGAKWRSNYFLTNSFTIVKSAVEARSLAAFHHPGIVTLYGFEEADGILCLIMELVEGPTLADRLKHESLPLPEALRIDGQIAEALEAAHERGILHRDRHTCLVAWQADISQHSLLSRLKKKREEEVRKKVLELKSGANGFGVQLGQALF